MQTPKQPVSLLGANSARHAWTRTAQRPSSHSGFHATHEKVIIAIDMAVEKSSRPGSERPRPWWHSIA